MSGLVEYTAKQIGDLIVGNGFGAVFEDYRRRKIESARQVLLSELKNDTKAAWQVANGDALFGAIHRFERAAVEGAATHNLRLLAKAMRNTLMAGDLTADRFKAFADVLAELSRRECWLLGTLDRLCESARASGGDLSGDGRGAAMWTAMKEASIPVPFASERMLKTALSRLQRTGLVMSLRIQHWSEHTCYETSPLMDELRELITSDDLAHAGSSSD